jgi:signal peptidase I
MFPIIKSGDIITVNPFDTDSISVGDIIFIESENRYFAHRLIRKVHLNGALEFITRGDHLPCPDQPVIPSQVLGKVVMLERNGKTIRLEGTAAKLMGYLITKTPSYLLFKVMFFCMRCRRFISSFFRAMP